jgi:hypothetical protein
MFRENELLILIGAGCSADAGIPTSKQMIQDLERLLGEAKWTTYRDLYHYVRSSILYGDGIKGDFGNNIDIERLVSVLQEIEKKESGVLFPFIGSWNQKLPELAGHNFMTIKEFREKILAQLKKWVCLDDYRSAAYYSKFFELSAQYNFPLRVFSLNYDLCVEKNVPPEKEIERGFDSSTKTWDWRRFEAKEEYEPAIYLYKLHGSIDWKRDKSRGNVLKEVDAVPDEPDLIFGVDYKMQYVDPYLFYAYELRKYSLDTKLILVIGYSFGDEHINGILKQALQHDKNRKMVLVSPEAKEKDIINRLGLDGSQVVIISKKAKDFVENELRLEMLEEMMGSSTD